MKEAKLENVINLTDIPIPLLAKGMDCVIAGHSSAVIEASYAGANTGVLLTDQLEKLSNIHPELFEIQYHQYNVPILSNEEEIYEFCLDCLQKSTNSQNISSSIMEDSPFSVAENILCILETSL